MLNIGNKNARIPEQTCPITIRLFTTLPKGCTRLRHSSTSQSLPLLVQLTRYQAPKPCRKVFDLRLDQSAHLAGRVRRGACAATARELYLLCTGAHLSLGLSRRQRTGCLRMKGRRRHSVLCIMSGRQRAWRSSECARRITATCMDRPVSLESLEWCPRWCCKCRCTGLYTRPMKTCIHQIMPVYLSTSHALIHVICASRFDARNLTGYLVLLGTKGAFFGIVLVLFITVCEQRNVRDS